MREVDAILQRLKDNANTAEIRNDIANLIADSLQQVQASLGYWEKAHFANAITALALWAPTPDTWLRLCLFNLEMALMPVGQRNENYTPRDHGLEALTYEQLVELLALVRSGS